MKPIAHFEEWYCITALGEVINLANNRPLEPVLNPNGYLKVSLSDGSGVAKQLSIHRLVAEHYLPNPYHHPQVNHKDGVKIHNFADNLEWCTAGFNAEHALRTGLRPGYMSANDKEAYLRRVLAGEQVIDIARAINRRPETLHKMLRETAKRLNIHDQWMVVMQENRKNAAIRNLAAVNNRNP